MSQTLEAIAEELDNLCAQRVSLVDPTRPEERKRLAEVEMHLHELSVEHNDYLDQETTYLAPAYGWVCFHCGHRFYSRITAQAHFGVVSNAKPACDQDGTDEEEG